MNVEETLNRAADLIEERGWVSGPEGWDGYAEQVSGLCLEGGIMAALGVDNKARAALYRDCPAYDAVAEYLGWPESPWRDFGQDELWQWNDADGRTAAEVVEVLRAAAVVASARVESRVEVDAR